MDQILNKTTASQGFAANLVLAFAGISLLLAGVGLYECCRTWWRNAPSRSPSASHWGRSGLRCFV